MEKQIGYLKCAVVYELNGDEHHLISNDEVEILDTVPNSKSVSGYSHKVIVVKRNHFINLCISLVGKQMIDHEEDLRQLNNINNYR